MSLQVTAEVGDWQEEEGQLLSFKSPEMGIFEYVGKKQLYAVCVKTRHRNELRQIKQSKWIDLLGSSGLTKGAWGCFYKQPSPKRTGDLQWRIVHGIIATNAYLAHLDPGRSRDCPFCSRTETTAHLFVQCVRLEELFLLLNEICEKLGIEFSPNVFVYGPGYSFKHRWKCCLANFIFGQAKLAIWLTRRNKILSHGSVCAKMLFKQFVSSRLRVEFAHAKLTEDVEGFRRVWAVGEAVCVCTEEGYSECIT